MGPRERLALLTHLPWSRNSGSNLELSNKNADGSRSDAISARVLGALLVTGIQLLLGNFPFSAATFATVVHFVCGRLLPAGL